MNKFEEGVNDLVTAFPELLSEWCYDKNDINPQEVYYRSTKVVWWKCSKCNNEYDTQIRIRTGGSNCPYCSGQRVLYGFNDLETWCKKNNKQSILDEWDCEKNGFTPSEVTRGTRKKAWWVCKECGNSWEAPIVGRTNGTGCPRCSDRKIWEKRYKRLVERKGSICDTDSELMVEWDYSKNTLNPHLLTSGSNEKTWWVCKECGNSWETSIANRAKGRGCPQCGLKKIWKIRRPNLLRDVGSLSITNPELLIEWDYDKNQLNPEEITYGCRKKVWWICKECGNNWEASIASRVHGYGCPSCGKEKGLISKHINIVKNRGSLQDSNADILKETSYEKSSLN